MKRFATMMGALLLVPTMACAELIEIAELTKEVPETWMEKIDVNGKTVSVDVPIYIPEVEKIDVLRIGRIEFHEDELRKGLGADGVIDSNFKNYMNYIVDDYSKQYGNEYFWNEDECLNDAWKLNEQSLSNIYAENQQISVYDAMKKAEKEMAGVLHEPLGFRIEKIRVNSSFQKTKKPGKHISDGTFPLGDLTGIGRYWITEKETINGIPLLATVAGGYLNDKDLQTSVGEALCFANPRIHFIWHGERLHSFYFGDLFEPLEIIKDNIQFCSFRLIKEALENEIESGSISNVYSIQFGYIICADPSQKYGSPRSGETFIAFPMWVIKCSYTGGNRPTSPYPVLEEMEENAFDYESADRDLQYVFINAQTGKVCDPNTVGTEKYNVPQIIE